MQRHRRWTRPLILVAALLACKTQSGADAGGEVAADPAGPGAAAVDTKPEPLPALRTGTRTVVAGKELAGKVTGRSKDATHEYLELALPITGDDTSLDFDRLHVELTGSGPGDVALIASRMGDSEVHVIVRRRPGTADAEVTGALFGERWNDGKKLWTRVPFRADIKAAREEPEVKPRFIDAFASMTDADWRAPHPWLQFAAGRVRALVPDGLKPGGPQGTDLVRPTVRTDLSLLMDTTTGVMSMQEALQHDRGLRVDRSDDARTIAVGELTHLLVDDPDTRAILLFLEALRDADTLAAAARPHPASTWGRSPRAQLVQ